MGKVISSSLIETTKYSVMIVLGIDPIYLCHKGPLYSPGTSVDRWAPYKGRVVGSNPTLATNAVVV